MLAFTAVERPWKDPEHQMLEFVNESLLYFALVLVLSGQSLASGSASSEIFGWMLIITLTLLIHINVVVIVAQAYRHLSLVHTAYKAKRKVDQRPI